MVSLRNQKSLKTPSPKQPQARGKEKPIVCETKDQKPVQANEAGPGRGECSSPLKSRRLRGLKAENETGISQLRSPRKSGKSVSEEEPKSPTKAGRGGELQPQSKTPNTRASPAKKFPATRRILPNTLSLGSKEDLSGAKSEEKKKSPRERRTIVGEPVEKTPSTRKSTVKGEEEDSASKKSPKPRKSAKRVEEEESVERRTPTARNWAVKAEERVSTPSRATRSAVKVKEESTDSKGTRPSGKAEEKEPFEGRTTRTRSSTVKSEEEESVEGKTTRSRNSTRKSELEASTPSKVTVSTGKAGEEEPVKIRTHSTRKSPIIPGEKESADKRTLRTRNSNTKSEEEQLSTSITSSSKKVEEDGSVNKSTPTTRKSPGKFEERNSVDKMSPVKATKSTGKAEKERFVEKLTPPKARNLTENTGKEKHVKDIRVEEPSTDDIPKAETPSKNSQNKANSVQMDLQEKHAQKAETPTKSKEDSEQLTWKKTNTPLGKTIGDKEEMPTVKAKTLKEYENDSDEGPLEVPSTPKSMESLPIKQKNPRPSPKRSHIFGNSVEFCAKKTKVEDEQGQQADESSLKKKKKKVETVNIPEGNGAMQTLTAVALKEVSAKGPFEVSSTPKSIKNASIKHENSRPSPKPAKRSHDMSRTSFEIYSKKAKIEGEQGQQTDEGSPKKKKKKKKKVNALNVSSENKGEMSTVKAPTLEEHEQESDQGFFNVSNTLKSIERFPIEQRLQEISGTSLKHYAQKSKLEAEGGQQTDEGSPKKKKKKKKLKALNVPLEKNEAMSTVKPTTLEEYEQDFNEGSFEVSNSSEQVQQGDEGSSEKKKRKKKKAKTRNKSLENGAMLIVKDVTSKEYEQGSDQEPFKVSSPYSIESLPIKQRHQTNEGSSEKKKRKKKKKATNKSLDNGEMPTAKATTSKECEQDSDEGPAEVSSTHKWIPSLPIVPIKHENSRPSSKPAKRSHISGSSEEPSAKKTKIEDEQGQKTDEGSPRKKKKKKHKAGYEEHGAVTIVKEVVPQVSDEFVMKKKDELSKISEVGDLVAQLRELGSLEQTDSLRNLRKMLKKRIRKIAYRKRKREAKNSIVKTQEPPPEKSPKKPFSTPKMPNFYVLDKGRIITSRFDFSSKPVKIQSIFNGENPSPIKSSTPPDNVESDHPLRSKEGKIKRKRRRKHKGKKRAVEESPSKQPEYSL